MKARIIPKSPLPESLLSEEQVNLYVLLSALHLRYGFGKKRLAMLLYDFSINKEQYNKIRHKEGKWSADSQLLRAVEECFGYEVSIKDFIGRQV